MGILDRFIETCLRWGGIVDSEVAATESTTLNERSRKAAELIEKLAEQTYKIDTTKINTTMITDPTQNPHRPIDNATTVYVRSPGIAGDVQECLIQYDKWWRPRAYSADKGAVSYSLLRDGVVSHWHISHHGSETARGYSWIHKSGPPIHFPTIADLEQFFPPDHPGRQLRTEFE